jgi:hypothetical protein
MKRFLLLTALAIGTSAFSNATVIALADGENPEVGDNFQLLRTWNLGGGLTMEVRAFRFDGTSFAQAGTTQFGVGNIGLGVCTNTSADECDFNEWQIDNNGNDDYVLFTFSAPVNIGNIVIKQTTFTADSDAAYYFQAAAAVAPSASWSLTPNAGPNMGPGDSRSINIGAAGVRTLLFGTGSGSNDYFKLFSIDVTRSTVPEPGSFVLIGAGLVGLGVLRRRQKQSK